jgi:hypothetical protein
LSLSNPNVLLQDWLSTHTVCKKLPLRWFDLWSGQFTKDYNIRIYCFSTKNAAVSSKNKDWVAQSLHNVLKWSVMCTYIRILMFHVYSIQHYVIKFVSDLWQVCGFLRVLSFPQPIKLPTTIYLKYCWKWH